MKELKEKSGQFNTSTYTETESKVLVVYLPDLLVTLEAPSSLKGSVVCPRGNGVGFVTLILLLVSAPGIHDFIFKKKFSVIYNANN
jgi:hypothetical protein